MSETDRCSYCGYSLSVEPPGYCRYEEDHLRYQRDQARQDLDALRARAEAAEQRAERLAEALRNIIDAPSRQSWLGWAQDVARAALAGEEAK